LIFRLRSSAVKACDAGNHGILPNRPVGGHLI
jgi:hypothetical protein